MAIANSASEVEPTSTRHVKVGHDDVRTLSLDLVERRLPIFGRANVEASFFEQAARQTPIDRGVVDDEDRRRGSLRG